MRSLTRNGACRAIRSPGSAGRKALAMEALVGHIRGAMADLRALDHLNLLGEQCTLAAEFFQRLSFFLSRSPRCPPQGLFGGTSVAFTTGQEMSLDHSRPFTSPTGGCWFRAEPSWSTRKAK